jgi:hypothetical protein
MIELLGNVNGMAAIFRRRGPPTATRMLRVSA